MLLMLIGIGVLILHIATATVGRLVVMPRWCHDIVHHVGCRMAAVV